MIKKLILFLLLLVPVAQPVLMHGVFRYDNQLVSVENQDVKKNLEFLAIKKMNLHPGTFVIKEHKNTRDLAESGRDGTIFFVQNRIQHNLAVMKVFHLENPYERADFQREKKSLQALKNQHFEKFYAVQLQYSGVFEANGKKMGVMIESPAAGTSLNSLVRKLSETSSFTEKHQLLYIELQHVFEDTAEALAELHKARPMAKPAEGVKEYYQDLANAYGKKDLTNLPGPFGFIHGDSHPGNIFYSPIQNRITFIDFANAECSKEGAPVAADVGRFLASFEMLATFYHLNSKDISALKESFIQAYQKEMPGVSKKTIELYYELNLMEYHNSFKKKDTHSNKQASHFYAFTTKKLDKPLS